MPEIKRIPQEGRMNLDLNERILSPGQYREALNVNVGRSETSEVGTVENLLGNKLVGDTALGDDATCIGSYRDNGGERIFFFVTTNESFDQSEGGVHGVYQYDQTSGKLTPLVTSSVLNFHKSFPITGVNLIEDLLFWTDDRNEPRKINIDRARNNPQHYVSNVLLSVAKPAPFNAATIANAIRDTSITSTFLRDKLPRFSYRWRFDDGEYSVLAPFTPIVFQSSITTIPEAEAAATGAVDGFVNNVNSVTLTAPVTTNAGVVSIEFIYSDTSNTNTYILDDIPVTSESAIGYTYQSQDPFRTLPGSQVTRVFDAVPRRAKSQEVAGGRIVYGNYLQNYNLPTVDFTVSSAAIEGNLQLPNQFVKSNRTYEVGIVLSDESGRTTPVILSNSGNGTRFVSSQGEKLTISFQDIDQLTNFHSYKVVVKQRQQEYYNLFTSSGSRNGDNASKVPIDFTEGVPEGSQTRPSSRSIYVDGSLRKVSIGTDGTIVMPTPLTGSFEVEPFESEIDIFFESSTGGLIEDVAGDTAILVDYYNCYLIDGIEANRIRMGFNDPAWDYGVRAHAVNEQFAGEERRLNTLIHSSGFFNSRTGLNQLNQFNEAEGGITLSLDPSDGSIQKLYAEDTQLIIWQEDKVSRSPIDKDFIYSAEGGAVPVTSNTQYLGTVAPYSGEYGISTDPGSFSVYGTRKYFTDRNRGVVLRLSNDGLTEISRSGMSDFFRDALRSSTSIIGSYNEYHNVYNLTISGDGYSGSEDTNRATSDDNYFTIGFEEDVSGWVSFKSFQQESGTTLNNRYYTFNNGNLWEHNNPAEGTRNSFYGAPVAESYIDFILNDSPSQVKTFNTIGYEGSSGWNCDYIQTEFEEIGDVPDISEIFVNATLEVVDSSAPNIRFTGERTNVVPDGDTTSWVIQVSPISNQYVLEREEQVELTIDTPGVSEIARTINDGSIFFLIQADAATEFTYEVSLGGPGAALAFAATILTINIISVVSNADILGTVGRTFNQAGTTATEAVDIIADEDYYLQMEDIIIDSTDIDEFLQLDVNDNPEDIVIENLGPDDVRISIPVLTPDMAVGAANLQVSGAAIEKPTLTWTIPEGNLIGFRTPLVTTAEDAVRVSPRDEDSVKTNEITVSVSETTTHFIDSIGVSVTNGMEVGSTNVNPDKSEASIIVLSDIDDSDLETTVNISSTAQEAAFELSVATDVEFSFLGGDINRNYTSNVNNILTADEPDNVSLSLDDTLDSISINVPEVTDGSIREDIVTEITVGPEIERFSGLREMFTITQMPRYFTESTGTVYGSTAITNTVVAGSVGLFQIDIIYPATATTIATATDFRFDDPTVLSSAGIANGIAVGHPDYRRSRPRIDISDTAVPGTYNAFVTIEGNVDVLTIPITVIAP